ncbi:hypothetical protein HED50_15115 [Ochrobactrum oryzae]|nr:hypothetical protein [Brucella oryzae]
MEEVEGYLFLVKPILREQQKPAVQRERPTEFRLLNLIGLTRGWLCRFTCIVNHLLEGSEKAGAVDQKRAVLLLQIWQYRSILCGHLWKEGRFLSIIIVRLSDPEGQFCTLK